MSAPQHVALPPPGWYADPSDPAGALRWWDGERWTGWTSPAAGPGAGPPAPVPADDRPVLPARAALVALAAIVASAVVSAFFGLAAAAVGAGTTAQIVAGQVGLWAVLLAACRDASRRYGSGSLARDLGWRFAWADLGLGLGAFVAGRVAAAVAILPLLFDERLVGNNDDLFEAVEDNRFGTAVVSLIALVGAPLVEELFFRGLVQRALTSRFGAGLAVVGQGLLFGLVHFQPTLGLANASVVAGTAAFGLVQGLAAHRWRRLGPCVVAHALFNLLATVVLLAT